jgi:dynein light chain 1
MPGTTCQKALQLWSEKNQNSPVEEAQVVKLMCMLPPIERLDNALNSLVNVRHLSLSTNCIDKMISLPNLKNIEILSLGRNLIKRIQGLEEIGATLKELWLSYNQISSLDGLHPCVKLTTLYITNNKIKDWTEIRKLSTLPELGNVGLIGNPIYEGYTRKSVRPQIIKNFPGVKVIDGEMVTEADTGVDEILDATRQKISGIHGSIDNALVTVPEFSDPTRTEPLPQDVAIRGLLALGLDDSLAENAYGRIDFDKKGSITVQSLRRALGAT